MPRSVGHFNRIARLNEIRKRRQNNKILPKTTIGSTSLLEEATTHIYTDEEIKNFKMDIALKHHPLNGKSVNIRSKLAYKQIMENVNLNTRYMLPGMFAMFGYREPKTKEQLEYYDGTPAVLFCGITRTKESAIREIGFNIHYFPPFARARILELVYNVFRQYYMKYFNEYPTRPSRMIDYYTLKKLLDRYGIGFGLRMYIPSLRGKTYVLPTRLVPTLAFTEGHFNGATLARIQRLWRKYKR